MRLLWVPPQPNNSQIGTKVPSVRRGCERIQIEVLVLVGPKEILNCPPKRPFTLFKLCKPTDTLDERLCDDTPSFGGLQNYSNFLVRRAIKYCNIMEKNFAVQHI